MALYLSLLFTYLKHALFQRESILIGSECDIQWAWEREPRMRYVSLSTEVDNSEGFDSHGVPVEEVMTCIPDIRSLIAFIRENTKRGHSFHDVRLIYATYAD